MESKLRGDLCHTLYDLELALQSISVNSGPLELTTAKDLLLQAQCRLAKSIAVLTSNSAEVVSTRTEQSSFTLTSPTLTSLSSSTPPEMKSPGLSDASTLPNIDWERASDKVKEAILKGIARGDIWLAKIRTDQHGRRIYANVCLEVFLRSRGTCLLEHINLGACTPEELPAAFVSGMEELVELHQKTGVENTGEYLSQEEDKQVGLGMLGLANLLALEGVTYSQFGEALMQHLYESYDTTVTPAARKIVTALQQGIDSAAAVARMSKMDRAFAIAPTASCSYRYTDRAGYTTTPELAPPIGRTVDRDSSTFGVETFEYGEVETAEEVGWDAYKRVVDGICEMLHRTGLFHGYSYNTWSDVVQYTNEFVENWLASPQTSMYYSLQVMQNTQAKDDALAALDGNFGEMFGFDDIVDDDETINIFNDPAACVGCAE